MKFEGFNPEKVFRNVPQGELFFDPEIPFSDQSFELQDYWARVLAKGAAELRPTLPKIRCGLPLEWYMQQRDEVWGTVKKEIINIYPHFTPLLNETELAFRVLFRDGRRLPLPGQTDTYFNTSGCIYWYGMDYQPRKGEYIGLTADSPWARYMLPGYLTDYTSIIFVYDNSNQAVLGHGETTSHPIQKPDQLRDHLRMLVTVNWRGSDENGDEATIFDSANDRQRLGQIWEQRTGRPLF